MQADPDLNWYTSVSARKNLTPRCPYAAVRRCPRYYQSISLLGGHGITKKLEPKKDRQLLEFWSISDIWPSTREEAVSISSSNNEAKLFSNLCPEVGFEVFGWFASVLSRFADETDRDTTHRAMMMGGVGPKWQWSWARISPSHYSECSVYSLLVSAPIDMNRKADILVLRPGAFGVSVDLKGLFRKLRDWFQTKKDSD